MPNEVLEMENLRQQMKAELGEAGYLAKVEPYKTELLRHQLAYPGKSIPDIAHRIIDLLEQRVVEKAVDELEAEYAKALYALAMVELMGGESFIKSLKEE